MADDMTDTSIYLWASGNKHYGVREARAIERAEKRGLIKIPAGIPQWKILELSEYFGPPGYDYKAPGVQIRTPFGIIDASLGDD